MVELINLAEKMAEMMAYPRLMGASRVAHLAWWTMKDLSRDGHLAGMMVAMKDALINLAFHLAVM